MSLLDFLLVAAATAILIFSVGGLVLWLTERVHKRRDAAEGTAAEAGRAQASE